MSVPEVLAQLSITRKTGAESSMPARSGWRSTSCPSGSGPPRTW
jgi:hypothetical protein